MKPSDPFKALLYACLTGIPVLIILVLISYLMKD
jgi:hypothetical protein